MIHSFNLFFLFIQKKININLNNIFGNILNFFFKTYLNYNQNLTFNNENARI